MDVISTSDPAKLPPEVLRLQDSGQPIPPDVQYFEEKFTYLDMAKQFLWGVVFIPIGALLMFLAVVFIIWQDTHTNNYSSMLSFYFGMAAVGLVFFFGGCWLLKALGLKFRLLRQQHDGVVTRYGVFLFGDLLVYRSWSDTTIIPKPFFKGLKDRSVQYGKEGETKSFSLPSRLIGKNVQSLDAAIASWAA